MYSLGFTSSNVVEESKQIRPRESMLQQSSLEKQTFLIKGKTPLRIIAMILTSEM